MEDKLAGEEGSDKQLRSRVNSLKPSLLNDDTSTSVAAVEQLRVLLQLLPPVLYSKSGWVDAAVTSESKLKSIPKG